MNVNFETINDLEEILIRIETVADTIQALSDACCESPFKFPKKALILPSEELKKIYKEYKSVFETFANRNVVKFNG